MPSRPCLHRFLRRWRRFARASSGCHATRLPEGRRGRIRRALCPEDRRERRARRLCQGQALSRDRGRDRTPVLTRPHPIRFQSRLPNRLGRSSPNLHRMIPRRLPGLGNHLRSLRRRGHPNPRNSLHPIRATKGRSWARREPQRRCLPTPDPLPSPKPPPPDPKPEPPPLSSPP